MSNKTMRIGLLDHMGYGNLGDAATQEALIANLKKRLPDVELVGFSLNPDDTRKRHNIICYSITHWHPGLNSPEHAGVDCSTNLWSTLKSIAKEVPAIATVIRCALNLVREALHLWRSFQRLRTLDALIIAGGGQLSELWRGPWSHPYNVFKFSLLAKLADRKLLFLNVGAGPLNSSLGRAFVKYAVDLADYVSLRDAESQDLIQQLGARCDTHVFPDSAYSLDVSHYDAAGKVDSTRPLVGINPIGFCDPRIWPKPDNSAYLRYLDKLTEFSRWLLSQNYRLRIFSGEVSVDIYAFEDLKERLLSSGLAVDPDEMFVQPSVAVKDLLTEMSRFDCVVTSKFHGVVFSHLLGKPVIALSYHRKIDDLMRNAGQSSHCLDIDNFDSEQLKAAFISLSKNGAALKPQFHQITQRHAELLREQFDELFVPRNLEVYPGCETRPKPEPLSMLQQ